MRATRHEMTRLRTMTDTNDDERCTYFAWAEMDDDGEPNFGNQIRKVDEKIIRDFEVDGDGEGRDKDGDGDATSSDQRGKESDRNEVEAGDEE